MKTEYLTDEEYNTLRDYCVLKSDIETLIVEIMLYTGCRTHEIMTMTRTQIKESGSKILIKAAKGSLDRWVDVDPDFMQRLIDSDVGKLSPNTKIITLVSSTPNSEWVKVQLRRLWYRVRRNAFGRKCAYNLHMLRHTFGTRAYRLFNDIVVVQQLMGHRNVNSTMRYVHVLNLEKMKDGLLALQRGQNAVAA